jgi:hypothetical protein
MGWTIRQICEDAYAELALASYSFDLTPEEMQWAARRLHTMMAMWNAKGICVGFSLATTPGGVDLDADSGLPAHAVEPVCLNLALRLGAGKGKTLPAGTLKAAKEGYDVLMLAAAAPRQQQLPGGMPLGAGHKPRSRPFTPTPDTSPIQIGEGGDLDFLEP